MPLRICLLAALIASAPLPALAQTRAERAVHESLVVLDTHFDTPANLARGLPTLRI